MKQDNDLSTVSVSYNPLTLYRLIEKTVLAQTEDQYPFATVYDQQLSFYSFRQSDNMSNPQWYERFNTKVDVGEAIGVTRQHKALLEHLAQEQTVGTTIVTFDSLTADQQAAVRIDAEERYISYVFLRQSGPQHGKLKVDLQNDFTTGDNHYPKTRQQTLHLLDKYSKTTVTKPTNSEGASFAQGGGGGSAKGKKHKETFDKAEPNGAGTKSSAAPSNLFTVSEDCEKISGDKAVEFHNLVAKTLYATKRARPDTCTAIAFLTTRVREPDKDDWKTLVHMMRYIRGSRKMPLILSANDRYILKWWVDASFAVHPNLRGHSGGGLSLGRGFSVVGSTKQKLNTRSSTEAELVGADDFMPAICWTRYFMEAQRYKVEDNVLYQDNKSSMLLEKNGKASSSKRTKHINIRYFFITDRINMNELSVVWCPTGNMIGDYATKPLQGAVFKKFRDYIMGVVPVEEPGPGKSKPIGGTSTRRPNG
jgi:hypothetical protein